MKVTENCRHNTDPLKLVREGVSQEQRLLPLIQGKNVPVEERDIPRQAVFAQLLAPFLKYFDETNMSVSDWKRFFSEDASALLALVAVQEVDRYRQKIKEHLDFLDNLDNDWNDVALAGQMGLLFSSIGSFARGLDQFVSALPSDLALKETLQNYIRTQLAPAFHKMLLYYRDATTLVLPQPPYLSDVAPEFAIMGVQMTFAEVRSAGLSRNWIPDESISDWPGYLSQTGDENVYPRTGIFGVGPTLFERLNYAIGHNLFKTAVDQFLKGYAKVVADARAAMEATFFERDNHEPHYTLFLAFIRLLEYAREEMNTLTGRHLDFYFREVLQIKERPALPGRVHLLAELNKHIQEFELQAAALLKAGKDDAGKEAFFANDRDFVANQAVVAALHTVYRHDAEPVASGGRHNGRLFASPQPDSDDGMGEPLTAPDGAWHPFYNKVYQDGALQAIKMPKARVGFAIASHYLYLAEGDRTITITLDVDNYTVPHLLSQRHTVLCRLSTEQGWIEKTPETWSPLAFSKLQLTVKLDGGDPPVTGFDPKVHGYDIGTNFPVLELVLVQNDAALYAYQQLSNTTVNSIDLTVEVDGLKTLAVSNDFGPVDTSKPFQPFGAQPKQNSSLVIGAKEVFQKNLLSLDVKMPWQNPPQPYGLGLLVRVRADYLQNGAWVNAAMPLENITSEIFRLTNGLDKPVRDQPDAAPDRIYDTQARHGFVRLRLNNDFGQTNYEQALIDYIKEVTAGNTATKPTPPTGPFATALSMKYSARQIITINSSAGFDKRAARFFHLAPFGHAERHPKLSGGGRIHLLPQLSFRRNNAAQQSEAEFYIGIAGLQPPQNLALLFQVADGTADPLSQKPRPHIHWSYLSANEWIPFESNEVSDRSNEWLQSGIITFTMPRAAANDNTILAGGLHWIRAAVASESDTVCRLIKVAAQAFGATFSDLGNDPAFGAKALEAGVITKLHRPDAAVKKIVHPFPSFGGRGAEAPDDYYTRVSERLRHKDRAIALWDYEHLILEAFPQIYRAKCLNHTQFEPTEDGVGIYRELAPGHVTIITLPNQQAQNLRNPLRPYTALGVLEDIHSFLSLRTSCFVKLHVRNPQFEEVRVHFRLRLFEGFDEKYYVIRLQEAIVRFLSPWAFTEGGVPSFGGKIYKASLINFVEEQHYVDYITDFQLFHDIGGVAGTADLDEVQGSRAVSILVSAPAGKHHIQLIHPAELEAPREKCHCDS
ncbi:MAG: baseplate J/gp47 family protein [Saprospiraceae bacterium]|nr:baseplate J/gp47 family protein [Saprospiraceae bacterium]HRD81158.1 baseplate J/gp47 family protein [Saprospiraceae bacterium]